MFRSNGKLVKVAVIGSGIAGNVAAYKLNVDHDVTVFEAGSYIGGHTNTVDVYEDERRIAIDTGFIVFNDRTYPNFIRLLDEIGQTWQQSEMSFSVCDAHRKFEFCGSTLNSLFAQRRNFLRPSFYRMIRDILRFNESMQDPLVLDNENQTLGDLLQEEHYSDEFRDHYIVPMAAAIWSAEPIAVLNMPVSFLVRFLSNHGLLQLKDRPQWSVVSGGSREYVQKLVAAHRAQIRLNSPVLALRRHDSGVEIQSAEGGVEYFDAVFIACHSDQALSLLEDPTPAESAVLGAIHYQNNAAILHTDESLMPVRKRAWAAWNYHVPKGGGQQVAVTYNMNILQRLHARHQYCVTLNYDQNIEPSKVLQRIDYQHPIFSREMVAAQKRHAEVNSDRTFYCGAYWKNGFHEDGVVSALSAIDHFQRRFAGEQLHLRRAS